MRGIFYSIITAVLIVPIVLSTLVYLNSLETRSDTLQIKALGDKLAGFSTSIDSDLLRATNIIAKNAVQNSINYIDSNGQPLDNASMRLVDLMRNGSLYGNITSQTLVFDSWVTQLQLNGQNYGFTTNITLLNLSITQADSYDVFVNIDMLVNLTDKTGKMRLERFYHRSINISISGFADPLYTLQTNGVLKKIILQPNITVLGTTNLDKAVGSGFYITSNGPTFLDRLEGKLTRSPQYPAGAGLETIVYLPDLQANGFAVNTAASDVDYLYFLGTNGCSVQGSSYGWLKLDNNSAAKYGVNVTCS